MNYFGVDLDFALIRFHGNWHFCEVGSGFEDMGDHVNNEKGRNLVSRPNFVSTSVARKSNWLEEEAGGQVSQCVKGFAILKWIWI